MKDVKTGELSTRDKLLDAALEFFSTKGYDATTVDEIADVVGMKGSIIYNYFSGKEDILNTLYSNITENYEHDMRFGGHGSLVWIHNGAELKQFSMYQIKYTIDGDAKRYRRLGMLNQFKSTEMAQQTTHFQFDNVVNLFEKIFAYMKDNGAIRDVNPRLLAIEYIGPTSVLIQLADREPDRREEVLKTIEEHIDFFIETHCIK